MFRLLVATVFALMLPTQCALSQASPLLENGNTFSTHGKLKIVFRGWSSYIILQTGSTYSTKFGDGVPKPVSTIELVCRGNRQAFVQHEGEEVSVDGKLVIDDVSPYFWNGVRLEADTVRLANGQTLRPAEGKDKPLPVSLVAYMVTVNMLPNHALWPTQVVRLPYGEVLPDGPYSHCSLNGGGDVMNCFCAEDFRPLRAGVVKHALPVNNWRKIPLAYFPGSEIFPGMAQFSLPDENAVRPLTYQLVCYRASASMLP